MLATVSGSSAVVALANLHGDIAITTSTAQTVAADGPTIDADEYGVVRDATGASTTGPPYAWLGSAQREATAANGLTLMGVRIYNPMTGRFLSTDPVFGGNETTFGYPTNPVSNRDFSGCYVCSKTGRYVVDHSVGSIYWRAWKDYGTWYFNNFIRDIKSFIDTWTRWWPGADVDITAMRYRTGLQYESIQQCNNGVLATILYKHSYFWSQGFVELTVHVAWLEWTIWERWITDPMTYGRSGSWIYKDGRWIPLA